jgi:protein-tyrosine kinase
LSLIENSLERMRRAAAASKEASRTPAAASSNTVHVERFAQEPRCAHRHTTINLAQLRAAGYLPDESAERRFADSCHRIKRPLIARALNSEADDSRLILLSSALPGDGKTFMTLNLALSMARERDISVLLVDGDLPRGQISRILGLHGEPGLLDALQDSRLDAESLIFDTDVPNLEVLPAGAPSERAAEWLASARMREIAARLAGRNPRRLVLFDSAPLLVSSEARVLAQIPGQIVLVVRAGRTPRKAIVDALACIEKKKLQGCVINDIRAVQMSEQGYYEYSDQDRSRGPAARSG